MNESLVLTKLLNTNPKQENNLQAILMKLQELKFFNYFIERFLKGTQKESLLNLCGRFKMEHHKGPSLLFQEGDKSNDKLYIIFRGSVGLFRAKKFDTFQQQTPQQTQPIQPIQQLLEKVSSNLKELNKQTISKPNFMKSLANSKRFANKLMSTLTQYTTKEDLLISQQEMSILNEKYGDTVRILGQGDGFGEVAIIEGTPRGLTACAVSQDCFLLILKKEDFDIVKQQFVQSIKEKKNLIYTKFEVKDAYSTALSNSLAYSFDVESFQHNAILAVEGMQQKVFYLIASGDILLEKYIGNKNIKICILTKGQFVAEEIVVNQDSVCEYSARVISNQATLMIMNKNEFFQKFPEECKQQIKKEYQRKKLFRISFPEQTLDKIADIQSPKTSPKQTIKIKVNPLSVRSHQSYRNASCQLDIKDILEKKKSIYCQKYQDNQKKCEDIILFTEMCYSPKICHTPSYKKLNNVLQKSFHQHQLKKIMRKKFKYNSSIDIPISQLSQYERSYKQQQTPSTNLASQELDQ
ncbi:unnamed protein product [Paramecium pentaurelia]|uniref:Cyclic nucleotide-binding domain-containing protein n=1 Tax=Paramecium pentaurelia TaxID=43138 RepID=A0A8S1U7U5_9CILI|nr:unnamed protein product [Paramecium pentaurelia]